ncbi:MAG: hypothetical protein ACJAT1_002394 [Marivirga sp.]|jgi:hypothetical protein
MNKIFICLVALVLFSSCNEEESPSLSSGNVWVVNEGNFGSANATIGVYNTNDSSYNSTAFRGANGYFIGDVLQSVKLENETAYGILNGSNTIEAFDTKTFESIETLENPSLDKPRYMSATSQGRAFVTVWGPYNTDFSLSNSKVLVVDLNNMEVVDSISTAPGIEQIELIDNTLLITRNFFGSYRHLTMININDFSEVTDMELPDGPDELFIDSQGAAWVVCTSGKLVKIDIEGQKIAQTIDLGAPVLGDVALFDGELYFLQGDKVNSIKLTSEEVTNRVSGIAIDLPYALGVNPFNGDIYLGDGVNFGSEGKVLHYNAAGDLVNTFQVGIFPSQFIFN